jgi:hypothetical protein
MRIVTEPLPGTAPLGQWLIAERTLHRVNRTANGIACARLERERKGEWIAAPFSFEAALRSLRSLPKHANPNATHPAHVPLTTYSPPALDPLDRSQSAPPEVTASSNNPPTKRQPVINQTSTKRQRNVNRSSTKRQRNIKSRTFSTRIEKVPIGWSSTERTARAGWTDCGERRFFARWSVWMV